jgi:hypothetical protein
VLFFRGGERLGSEPVDETCERRPETAVNERDLPLDETKPDDVV